MVIKKVLIVLTALLTAISTITASPLEEEKTTNFVVTPSIAYRYDMIKWSIPSRYHPEKKLSELVWKNHIVQTGIKLETNPIPNQLNFIGQAKYGYILKNPSTSRDLDWIYYEQKSGKLKKTTHSNTISAVKGNIFDLSGAVGYSITLPRNNLLTLYVGFDYADYRNKQYGFCQKVDNKSLILHPFNQLGSKYDFKTQSPWIGLSLKTPINDRLSITPTIKFYSFKYTGKGYWLLRDDFQQDPSFKHHVKGTGLGFDVDFLYKYSDNLDFKINLETKRFKMKTGREKTYHSSKSIHAKTGRVSTNKLFDVTLFSSSISGGVRYKF